MTEDGSFPIIFEFFPDLRNAFVLNTCKHVSNDNEVYFPKVQKTSWMIQNIFLFISLPALIHRVCQYKF